MLQDIAIGVAVVCLIWYPVGTWLNRQRAQQLIGLIREAAAQVGQNPTIRWYGGSAFQVEITEPQAPLTACRLLCLLEPREFPLAQLWTRLRGRRDQIMLQSNFTRPPTIAVEPDPSGFAIPGLTAIHVSPAAPHLELTLQLTRGTESALNPAFALLHRQGDRS